MPFVSKQKGRMSMLLKQKSKIQAVPKERIKYDAYNFSMRARDPELRMAQQKPAEEEKKDTINMSG